MPKAKLAVEPDNIFDEAPEAIIPTVPAAIPDFKKMKKKALLEWFVKHAPLGEMELQDFQKLTAPVMKQTLIDMFPDVEALFSSDVTGFDGKDPIHHTVAIVQALASEEAAIDYINSLSDENQFNFFRMGGALAEMQAHGWYGEYDDFGSFVEAEFGFKLRKAQYLISIYNALVVCDCKWSDVKDVGWSKLALVAPHLTPENYKKWLKKISSQELTFTDLHDFLKNQLNANGDGKVVEGSTEQKVLKFHVHADQIQTINDAIDKAKEVGETKFDGPALEYVCLDYLAGPGAGAHKAAAEAAPPEVTPVNVDDVLLNVIQTIVAASSEPVVALEAMLSTINDFFVENEFPDLDFDVYPYGKPDNMMEDE